VDLLKYPKKSISYIENPNVPLLYYFLTFFAVISLRNFLDIFSDTARISFTLFPITHELFMAAYVSLGISFAHFYLFWIALFLIFPFIATFITKQDIGKTLRIILGFSWIIVITPIADLLLSRGQGIEATFIAPTSLGSIIPLPQALNPGEKITCVVSILLIFTYAIVKTKKLNKALLLAFLFYLVNMLSFMFPFLITSIARIFNKAFTITSPANIIPILSAVIVVEAAFLFYLYDKKFFISIVKSAGILKSLQLVFMFTLGILLFRARLNGFIFNNIGLFFLSSLVIMLALTAITLFKRSRDGLTPCKTSLKISSIALLLAILCAASINITTLFFLLVAIACAFIYYLPPLKLMRIPFFSKVFLALMILLIIMLGWLFAGGELSQFPQIFSLYILIFFTGCLNITEINKKQDAAKDAFPLLEMFGEKRYKLFIGCLFFLSYLLIPLVLVAKILLIPSILFAALFLFFIVRKNYQEHPIILTYTVSLAGILIWLNYFRITG